MTLHFNSIKNNNINSTGFTLIELLLSVLIIVILSGIGLTVINPSQVRNKALDSQRVADLKTIQTALEQYYLTYKAYPASIVASTTSTSAQFIRITGAQSGDNLSTSLLGGYLSKIPLDPNNDAGASANPCSNTESYRYNYWAPARSTSTVYADKYMLTAMMQVKSSNDGNECGRLVNWGSMCSSTEPVGATCPGNGLTGNDPTYATCDVCYGVESK